MPWSSCNISRFIALFGVCLTLSVFTTTVHYGKDYHQQLLLRRNLRRSESVVFSPSQRRLTDKNLRFLALGGPSTAGRGLANPLDAYPYQLSRSHNHNVHNYASRMSFPAAGDFSITSSITNPKFQIQQQQIIASLCAQSIVGDDSYYDVITLEYESIETASLSLLTQRLRERFPRAILVFVKLWSPLDLYYEESSGEKVSFSKWRAQNVESTQWTDKQAVIEAMKEHTWLKSEDELDDELDHIVHAAIGKLHRMTVPTSGADSYADLVPKWFVEEQFGSSSSLRYDLSSTAQSMLAKTLEEVVLSEVKRQSSTPMPPLLGSWGSGDSCQLWYENGKGISHLKYTRGLQYKEFSNHYALEVGASTGGSLQVHNPFDEDRMVYLTYMTTSANASSKKVYPKTKVRLSKSIIVLDPTHEDNGDTSHRTRTSAVGMVPAGATVPLEFSPLEEYTLNKFRIVGLSFLAKEKVTYKIPSEFAMMSAHGLVVEDEEEGGTYTSYGESFLWWGDNSISTNRLSLSSDDQSSTTIDDHHYDQPTQAQFRHS
jgi:hypothetical protein